MKKILISLFCIILFGGIGYFYYGEKNSVEGKPNIVVETTTEREEIEKEEVVEVRTNVPLDMVWEYSFDSPLEAQSVSNDTISIMDEENERVDIRAEIVGEGKTLLIHPPAEGYEKGEKYDLSISKELAYIDGTKVSEDYNISFVTIREEVVEGQLNPNIIQIAEKQVRILEENKVEIQKNGLIKPLEAQNIIIVPTEQHPEGQALKITTVEEKSNTYIIDVVEPEFVEIYEELDINKSYPLDSKNFTPGKMVSGMRVKTISASNPFTLLAGIDTTKDKPEGEFKEKENKISAKINDGIQIDFANFKLDKKMDLVLDGTVHLFSPEVKLDMEHGFLKIDHMSLETEMTVVNDITLKRAGKDAKTGKKVLNKKPKALKANVGTINIPTGVPGLLIQGNLIMRFDVDINGVPEVLIFIEYNEKTGVYYDGEEVNNISNSQMSTDFGVQGKGEIAGKAGPSINLLASGFGVAGVGAEGYSGLRLTGKAVAGADTKNGPYACGSVAFGGFGQLSFVVNTLNLTLLEFIVAEFPIGSESVLNNCETIVGFAAVEPIGMDSSEEIEVTVENQLQDLLSNDSKVEIADMENVDIVVSDNGVLDVKKKEDGIIIQSAESPSRETTKIILTQQIDGKEKKLVIPVRIENFKELQYEQAAEEEVKVEEVETGDGWEGEWERFDFLSGGLLTITEFDGQSFNMSMSVAYGGRSGQLEGVARVTGDKAVYVDDEFDTGCRLELVLKGSSIQIEQNENCSGLGGLNTYFFGEYVNTNAGISAPIYTLSSRNILDQNHDSVIQKMLGSDYDYFVESMHVIYSEPEKYGLTDTLIYEGGVPGLYTIMEGIILIEPEAGYYYVAYIIDGSNIKFHTNNASYQSELPAAINQWRERFSQYSIEYIYKEIN